jgi:hypothetical protein
MFDVTDSYWQEDRNEEKENGKTNGFTSSLPSIEEPLRNSAGHGVRQNESWTKFAVWIGFR